MASGSRCAPDILQRDEDLFIAASKVLEGHAVAIARDGRVLAVEDGDGVKPLILAARKAGREARGASLADRVVGLAAARLARYYGIRSVYGLVGSEEAAADLKGAGITFVFSETVPYIMNRSRDGRCPMESLALKTSLPEETYRAIAQMLRLDS